MFTWLGVCNIDGIADVAYVDILTHILRKGGAISMVNRYR